ncbi:MAG: permease prefix domain 1-containing protein [Candidatus Izemoplasmatales bacterium]
MNRIKKFVSKLLKDYFNEQDKRELIDILSISLEEKVEDLVEQGTPVDAAVRRSIEEFGSTDDVLQAFPGKSTEFRANLVRKRRGGFLFAVFGYVVVVGLALFVNLWFRSFFKDFLWFVIVAIGTLFWPAAMLYRYRTVKK